ncbi:MAG: glucose-6-phosphate dehydrogenase [Actinomycetes bacterium]
MTAEQSSPRGEAAGPAAVDPQTVGMKTLLILGASGDLTHRLLLPGLGSLLTCGHGEGLKLVGSGMDDWDDETWRATITSSFEKAKASGDAVESVKRKARYRKADVTAPDDLTGLLGMCEPPVAIFFALPPAVTAKTCQALTKVELPTGTRFVMEKPFGTDETSARTLNRLVTRLVPEDHVHRVDHFLGKSTVLNIVGTRFANRLLEPVLNSQHVASVDIVFDESLGLEGRAGYYDHAGALVDMIQSHLLQVLSLLAMEPPPTLSASDVRDRKAHVLRATKVWDDDPVANSRRARYTTGEIDGRQLPSYVDEKGVDPAGNTETLAEVVLEIDNWRWAGVPFRLRSGKALARPRKEGVVTFKRAPRVPAGLRGDAQPDRLRIGFGPDTMSLDLNINGPADPFVIETATLSTDFAPGELTAYGEVLLGVLEADPTLSVRGDTAEQCWRIVQPVLDAWRRDDVPMEEYPAGSEGPKGWPA